MSETKFNTHTKRQAKYTSNYFNFYVSEMKQEDTKF